MGCVPSWHWWSSSSMQFLFLQVAKLFFVSNNHSTIKGVSVSCLPHFFICYHCYQHCKFSACDVLILCWVQWFAFSLWLLKCCCKLALRICANTVQIAVQVSVQIVKSFHCSLSEAFIAMLMHHSNKLMSTFNNCAIVHCSSFRKHSTNFLTTIFNSSCSHACALTC